MTSAVSWDSREITNVSASSSVAMRAETSIGATLNSLAPVAQGIERAPPERKVAGSIPARRISRGYHEHSTRRACTSAPYGSITNGDIHPLTLSAAAASLGRGPSLVRAFKFLALL